MEPHRTAAELVAQSKALLLDFDGPVCDVYAGSDPAKIAQDVVSQFQLAIDTDDPLDLISYALDNNGPVDEIHQVLTATEVEAIRSATETPGVRSLIGNYQGEIAIVSNNAAEAIEQWLTASGLRGAVKIVTGRDPRRMKPDPRPLVISVEAFNHPPSNCVFVGASLTDLEAGRLAAIPVVALANRSGKRAQFEAATPAYVIDSLTELVTR